MFAAPVMAKPSDVGTGPSLETYVETRLNLLTVALNESAQAQTSALGSSIEATKEALAALDRVMAAALQAAELRYQQRFDAQGDALAAAFLSQQVAMKAALEAAKEAVQAALAAADRAVSKAELAADKRFEALNELRQMLNDMVATLFPRTEAVQRFDAMAEKIEAVGKRIETVEARINTFAGGMEGNRRFKDDSRLWIGLAISAVVVALLIARYFGGR